MEFAFRVLAAVDYPVTLETAYDLLTSDDLLKELMETLAKDASPESQQLAGHYHDNFLGQPAEQLGGGTKPRGSCLTS
jgi:hypothetical protein